MKYFQKMVSKVVVLVMAWSSFEHVLAAGSNGVAELFSMISPNLFQIRVIDNTSGEKTAIGSGFQIDEKGTVATNFHVISTMVLEPGKYHLEYAQEDGKTGELDIIAFDIARDLALVKLENPGAHSLELDLEPLINGEALYAVGNPRDLGQSIVPGSYNGLVEGSFYEKLLFTGSLNPGMSGGPAINEAGRVVGVNVSTAGNQISFLIPAVYLDKLVRRSGEAGWGDTMQRVEEQLITDQNVKYSTLFRDEWVTQEFGRAHVLVPPGNYFRCWGNTYDDPERPYTITNRLCESQDEIFISPSLTTGHIDLQFMIVASEELNPIRFSGFFGTRFSSMTTRNKAEENDVANYKCHQDYVKKPSGKANNSRGLWRSVFCARQYKKYPMLHDVLFSASYISGENEGFSTHFALSGVTQSNAKQFLDRFIRTNRWD